MRPPNKRRASYRLAPEVRDQLAGLAARGNQTQTAVLEGLIADAACGADGYVGYLAGYYAFITHSLVLELVRKELGDDFPARVSRARTSAADILGDIPPPPQAACDRARARLESGKLHPSWAETLRTFGLIER